MVIKMDSRFLTELIDKSEISLNYLGLLEHPKGFEITKNFFDFDVIHTISGSYTLIINDKKYITIPRDSFLIMPNSALSLVANENSSNMYFHFSVLYEGKMNLKGTFEDYKLPSSQLIYMRLLKKYR